MDEQREISVHPDITSEDLTSKPNTLIGSEKGSPRQSITPQTPEQIPPPQEEQSEYITGLKLYLVLAAITTTAFLALLDTTIVATAIPRITSQFHSLDDVGWYGSAYLLCNCALQLLAGNIYTYFNTKYSFLAFIFVFELGSLICGIAVNSKMLIVGRAVAGMGGSGLMNGSLSILSNSVPIHKRPFYTGILFSFAQVAVVLSPILGGVFTEYSTWRWCFYINLPLGALVMTAIFFLRIPQQLHPDAATLSPLKRFRRLDLLGFVLFAPAAIMFLLALQWGGTTYPWSSSTVIGLFVGSFFTFLVFLYQEHRLGDAAMLPFSIIKIRAVWSSCIFNLLSMGTLMTITFYLPIYFQAVKNDTPTMSGVHTLPMILSQMLFSIISGVGLQKLRIATPFTIAGLIFTAISYGLFSTLTPFTSVGKWVGYQIIAGVGRGLAMQMPLITIQNSVPKQFVTIGTTFLIFSQYFGGTLLLSFGQVAFTDGLRTSIPKYAPGADAAMVINAGATAFRKVVSAEDLPGVVKAYSVALDHLFLVAVGFGSAGVLFVYGMGWARIQEKESAKSTVVEAKKAEA